LIANAGVAVNEKFEYVKILVNDINYIVAKELLESLVETFK
jgi:isoleucyl-tRNA synthetase